MKYTEEQFKKEVESIYGDGFELISHFKGISKPILVKDKYGILEIKYAKHLLQYKPSIMKALNKTEYFMNVLKEKQPEIHNRLVPMSEYETARKKMLFEDPFGILSITPDSLIAGHCPNIRSAVDRKKYFYNMLKDIYGDRYDFIITTSDRKNGRSILICPEHGEVDIDNEYIFVGKGCPKCITQAESNVFYLIKMTLNEEEFFKLGVSYLTTKNEVRRYSDYRILGYSIEEIKLMKFDSTKERKALELKLKRLIKNNIYTPTMWPHKTSTECFKEDLLDIILKNI